MFTIETRIKSGLKEVCLCDSCKEEHPKIFLIKEKNRHLCIKCSKREATHFLEAVKTLAKGDK